MKLSFDLLIDTGVLLVFLSLTITIHYITLFLFQGLAGFQILTFQVLCRILASPEMILLYTPPFIIFGIASWICSELTYFVDSRFNLSDVGLISVCFCFCMFLLMAYSQASFVRWKFNFNEGEKIKTYYEFSWEGLDSSLTPAIISTLLIVPGMLIAYYH